MVISYKYKYLFVGLPNSGSSAISKELIENYSGEYIENKHTNIPFFKLNNKINLSDFIIFGVYRDPIDICFSQYNKIKVNAKGAYTNINLLKSKGGYVTNRQFKFFKSVQLNKLSFEEYLFNKYKFIPYDNMFSVNKPYFNFVIRFDNLNEDFLTVLNYCGINNTRNLPMYNVTDQKEKFNILNPKMANRIFSPFIFQNKSLAKSYDWFSLNFFSYLLFYFFKPFRWVSIFIKDKNRNSKFDSYFKNYEK